MQDINEIAERIKWHLSIPACQTLSGLRIHLVTIGLSERWKLMSWLRCDDAESLIKRMWRVIRR